MRIATERTRRRRPSLARGKRKGDSEDGHDERDGRVGDLAVELHAEPFGVEAGLAQVGDVTGESSLKLISCDWRSSFLKYPGCS